MEEARSKGMYLGRFGQYPTIYKRGTKDYIVVEKGEWPPSDSWPFLKWDGDNWVPVLAKLETVEQAQEASDLFSLLGHNTIIVEFPGITFDIFFREAHVPTGAWIICELDANYSVRYMKLPESSEDIEDYDSEAIDIEIVQM
ncbi:MAG: hypothetical protein E4H14_15580 [Candidatus Thorarchaeota archaeon]|nr:MAG: hypothetical protein E4H14_15580 [Candidatus Thorarchaeota archaeon]